METFSFIGTIKQKSVRTIRYKKNGRKWSLKCVEMIFLVWLQEPRIDSSWPKRRTAKVKNGTRSHQVAEHVERTKAEPMLIGSRSKKRKNENVISNRAHCNRTRSGLGKNVDGNTLYLMDMNRGETETWCSTRASVSVRHLVSGATKFWPSEVRKGTVRGPASRRYFHACRIVQ